MKAIILIAVALATIASAPSAHANEELFKAPCSVADRGHPRVTFDECNIDVSRSQGVAYVVVTTPNGRRFVIQNHPKNEMDVHPPWTVDGRLAKERFDKMPCYDNRLVSVCSTYN